VDIVLKRELLEVQAQLGESWDTAFQQPPDAVTTPVGFDPGAMRTSEDDTDEITIN
jgi:hypothetical protein